MPKVRLTIDEGKNVYDISEGELQDLEFLGFVLKTESDTDKKK